MSVGTDHNETRNQVHIRDSDFPGQSIINSRVGSVQSPVRDVFLIVGLHAVKSDTWVTRVILYEEFKEA
jgi:hypothetical protein